MQITVLKPRVRNTPFVWDGVAYQPVIDDLGLYVIECDREDHLARMRQFPDVFLLPTDPATASAEVDVGADANHVEEAAGAKPSGKAATGARRSRMGT